MKLHGTKDCIQYSLATNVAYGYSVLAAKDSSAAVFNAAWLPDAAYITAWLKMQHITLHGYKLQHPTQPGYRMQHIMQHGYKCSI